MFVQHLIALNSGETAKVEQLRFRLCVVAATVRIESHRDGEIPSAIGGAGSVFRGRLSIVAIHYDILRA